MRRLIYLCAVLSCSSILAESAFSKVFNDRSSPTLLQFTEDLALGRLNPFTDLRSSKCFQRTTEAIQTYGALGYYMTQVTVDYVPGGGYEPNIYKMLLDLDLASEVAARQPDRPKHLKVKAHCAEGNDRFHIVGIR